MSKPPRPQVTHVAPVLIVDEIESCVAFWVDRFGFEPRHQAPAQDGALFFASVATGDVEIMYQTRASVLAGNPAAASELAGRSVVLFFTVPNLEAVEHAVRGAPVVKPRHRTAYGSTEIYVREPGGHTIGFAEFGASAEEI